MGKIFVIIGKSSTGKDTIYQRIVSEFKEQLKVIVMYTTRPIRDGEKNGREYHFVSEQDYQNLMSQGKVIEERAYETVYGVWRYFTVNDGNFHLQTENYIMTGTLVAYEKIKEHFGEANVEPIYIDVETGERLTRALNREKQQNNPKYVELCRRFIADETDFAEENIKKAGITKRYQNDDLEKCVKEIQSDILAQIQ